jgi:hypothetical protein
MNRIDKLQSSHKFTKLQNKLFIVGADELNITKTVLQESEILGFIQHYFTKI